MNNILKELVLPLTIIMFVAVTLVFITDYFGVKYNVEYSLKCHEVGLTYQKVDTIWMCK